MTEEETMEWRSHPLTKAVFTDLKALQRECEKNALELALSGNESAGLAYQKGLYDAFESVIGYE